MAAPKGNRFWEARTSVGRKRLFDSPEALWEACCEYFQWVEDNPLWEAKPFHYQGQVTIEYVEKMRAMTIDGLCRFLRIDNSTWSAWRKTDVFSNVVKEVDGIIRDQKFAGASADLLNANIIARDLGLKERQDVSNEDGSLQPKVIERRVVRAPKQEDEGSDGA